MAGVRRAGASAPPRIRSNRQDAPKVIWIDLPKVKFDPGSPVVVLNPDSVDLSGDVSDKFKEAEKLPY